MLVYMCTEVISTTERNDQQLEQVVGLLAVGSLEEENRCWGLASMHSFPLFQLMPTMIKYSISRRY